MMDDAFLQQPGEWFVFIIRLYRMQNVHRQPVAVIGESVGQNSESCRSGWTDQDAAWWCDRFLTFSIRPIFICVNCWSVLL